MTHRRRNDVDPVTIMINRWERDLILDYGYPFENIERQFRESGDADLASVIDVPFYWEQSTKHIGAGQSLPQCVD